MSVDLKQSQTISNSYFAHLAELYNKHLFDLGQLHVNKKYKRYEIDLHLQWLKQNYQRHVCLCGSFLFHSFVLFNETLASPCDMEDKQNTHSTLQIGTPKPLQQIAIHT